MILFAQLLEVGIRARLQRLPLEGSTMPPTDADDKILRISRGEDVHLLLSCFDEDDARADITGAAITFRAKYAATDPDPPAIALAVGDGITLSAQSGATLGDAEIVIAGARTAALTPGTLDFEARTVLGGDTTSVIKGTIVLEREV